MKLTIIVLYDVTALRRDTKKYPSASFWTVRSKEIAKEEGHGRVIQVK